MSFRKAVFENAAETGTVCFLSPVRIGPGSSMTRSDATCDAASAAVAAAV
jgi:hypothetical protein